jgi:hypothetical protein
MTVVPSTPDADPTVAPFKLSSKTGKRTLSVTVKAGGNFTLRYWALRLGGTNFLNGTLLASRGAKCGISLCGACELMGKPYFTGDTVDAVTIDWNQVYDGGADGDRTINLYGAN